MTLIEVLRGGRQCDNDGVEIIMSRQACVEAADELEKLRALLARYRDETPIAHQPHMLAHLVDKALCRDV